MNTERFEDRLLEHPVLDKLFPVTAKQAIKDRIHDRLEEMKRSGDYRELGDEEIRLLAHFQEWLNTPEAATGIFHYKREK
jgi:hypothetical protein